MKKIHHIQSRSSSISIGHASKSAFSSVIFGALISATLGLTACNGTSSGTGDVLGQDGAVQAPVGVTAPPVSDSPVNTPAPVSTIVGDTCHSTDSSKLCLALKYTVYTHPDGTPVVSRSEAIANVQGLNKLWASCNIAFQMDELADVDPVNSGLTFATANNSELDKIRSAYENNSTLLVVTTGNWNRSGSLGSTGANAWTNMPGNYRSGSILEAAVGTFYPIIAHEIGHYLNLDHVSDSSNLMNPVIYGSSTGLTAGQCSAARSAAQSYWKSMLR
ncbi:MAG: matrixin family metalloprotease [Methylotenera sp.]|nr:matrixin family metalloprotease [Oligoflexia bacterium]